jgi:hypothetical protein
VTFKMAMGSNWKILNFLYFTWAFGVNLQGWIYTALTRAAKQVTVVV